MFYSRGEYVLMVDADGATHFPDIEKLEKKMKEVEKGGLGLVIGSRAHLKESNVERKFHRKILAWGFHQIVKFVGVQGIEDTQCGFKLFTRKCAERLILNQHIERFAFDVELLFLAQQFNISIGEVGVDWKEIEGSKVSPLKATIEMTRDMLKIRSFYFLGIWKVFH